VPTALGDLRNSEAMNAFHEDDIPGLRPPEDMPPVHTQTDLHRHWRALMGELGFAHARLYVLFVPPDGRVEGLLMEIDELPDLPDAASAAALMACCKQVVGEALPPQTRLAVLYARPGRRGPSVADRAWAGALTAAADRAGIAMWQVHVANDDALHVIAPDDLVEPA
jgi:hypothetical protein